MTIEKAGKARFQETRRSRKARYARKEGRIGGRFVRVPLAHLEAEYGPDVVALVKAGAVRHVIAVHDDVLTLSREATGGSPRVCEVIGGFPPGTGRIEAVRFLKRSLEATGGGYNRILYVAPSEYAH